MNESWSQFKVEGHADVYDANLDANMARQHIDPRATAQEVQDHLRSHRRGIGTDTLHRHPMIGGEGKDRSTRNLWLYLTRDHDIPRSQVFKSAQATDRLRQSIQAYLRLCQEMTVDRLNPVNGFMNQHSRQSSYFTRMGIPLIVR